MVSRESRGRVGRGVCAGGGDAEGGFGVTIGGWVLLLLPLLCDLIHCTRLATRASASFRGPILNIS